ncbi:hypothetical protein D3C75_1138970 [compost metagenome]
MVNRCAFDNGQDGILMLQCLIKRFQQHHGRPFSTHIPVCFGIECPAGTVLRKHPRLVIANAVGRMAHQMDAAHKRLLAFSID